MSYDSPIQTTYSVTAASVATGATQLHIVGPSGLRGKVVAMSYAVTTEVTVATSTILVGTAADTNAYASQTVALGAADTLGNTFTSYDGDGSGSSTASNLIAADTLVEITTGSGATAGVVTLHVTIKWF